MKPTAREALVDRLAPVTRAVEVGIGRRPAVAAALAEAGVTVTATDVVSRDVPTGVRFVHDDVTAPDPAVYARADVIYALNLPPELHRATLAVARRHDTAFVFTTLGGDHPAVSVRTESHRDGTLFWGRELGSAVDADPRRPDPTDRRHRGCGSDSQPP